MAYLKNLTFGKLRGILDGIRGHIAKQSTPAGWEFGGFNEIRTPRRKSRLIAHDQLVALSGCDSYTSFLNLHDQFLARALEKEALKREGRWSESLAVGGKAFVREIKAKLGGRASGRQIREKNRECELRESRCPYYFNLGAEKEDIVLENMFFWNEF